MKIFGGGKLCAWLTLLLHGSLGGAYGREAMDWAEKEICSRWLDRSDMLGEDGCFVEEGVSLLRVRNHELWNATSGKQRVERRSAVTVPK